MNTDKYTSQKKALDQELKDLAKKREHYRELRSEVERLAEDMHYHTQHGRQVIEEITNNSQKDPEIQAVSEQNLQDINNLTLTNHNFLEESRHIIREKLQEARWQEEECREKQKNLQRIIDYQNKPSGYSGSRL